MNELPQLLHLLRRPRPLPAPEEEEQGVYQQWPFKGVFYRKCGLPKVFVKGKAKVKYASLVICGKYPKGTLQFPLTSIGYVESENDILDVRGCNFRILLFGVPNIVTVRDTLRFLIVRQRVPHSLLGNPFEWQMKPIKNDKQLKISKISPFKCFQILSINHENT